MTSDAVQRRHRIRPQRADKANLADLWEWAFGGRDTVGIDEQLRTEKRERRLQTILLFVTVLACNPISVHLAQPLLKWLP